MNLSLRKGFSFGLTSAIITTLGLIVGLHSWTGSKSVVIGGIITIAVADTFSDALGIHISEEAENHHNQKEVWTATIATFIAKFFFALTFIIPLILFSNGTAIIISIIYGLVLLTVLSYYIAEKNKSKVIAEHIVIAVVVIAITYYIGEFISKVFV